MKKLSLKPLHLQDVSAHRQFIYGVAALWILIYHMNSDIPSRSALGIFRLIQITGTCGVEVFLLLTGYGLYCALNRNPDVVRFYRRRLVRVLLPALILFFGCDLIVCPLLYGYAITPRFLLTWPWGGRMWYVSFILIMYLFYPLLHRWNRVENRRGWWIAVLLFAAASFAFEFLPLGFSKEFLRAFTRIPAFLLGCMLALPARENRAVPRRAEYVFTLVAIAGVAVWRQFKQMGQMYAMRMMAFFFLSAVVILLLTRIAQLLQRSGAGKKTYAAFFFCGSISLEIYLVFDRVRELLEFVPVVTALASPVLDVLAALIAIPLAWLLRRLCLWIADGLGRNWKIR